MKKLDSELKHEVCHWAAFYVSQAPQRSHSVLLSWKGKGKVCCQSQQTSWDAAIS
jgi:hypothetical protein